MKRVLLPFLAAFTATAGAHAGDDPSPLKILLVTGGCCHDYKTQKDLLKHGLEARIRAVVDQVHIDDDSTHPALPIYGHPDYARGYDVIIHDECAADIKDPAIIQGVLKPHQEGVPAVNLHCAIHSYRFGNFAAPVPDGASNAAWYEYLGLQSTGHGPQESIAIHFMDAESPITKGLADWSTGKEELYNNVRIYPDTHALATGRQIAADKEVESVVAWTHTYRGARVFCTTLGHNNATVADPRYLDLVARGVLWATGRLDVTGQPLPGYGASAAKN
jgi:type 1 glutamine amidotransferase